MKLSDFINKKTLTESKDFFPDIDVLKIDPDRADAYDIVQTLMPTLVRIAYVNLMEKKIKYDRTHKDKDDEPFVFNNDALEDELDDLIKFVRNRMDDLSSHDKKSYIDKVKTEFSEKLIENKN